MRRLKTWLLRRPHTRADPKWECLHTEELGLPEGLSIVETYNGGSRDNENQIALDGAEANGYRGIGGSDAHIVSHIGRCGTGFSNKIESMGELVEALAAGEFEAVNFKSDE